MKQKLLTALFIVMMLVPAFAAVTVTINTPTANTSYNNNWQETIDINFTVADDNTAVEDLLLNIYLYDYSQLPRGGTTVISDGNIFDYNANPVWNRECYGIDFTSFTCRIIYDLPNNTNLGDGAYSLDVNVTDTKRFATEGQVWNADDNATNAIVISTGLTTAESTRSLMATVGLILAGAVLIMGLFGIVFLKLDPMKTSIITVAAAVAAAIAAQIIGVVLSTL